MNFSQVLYCNGVAKISDGGTFSKNVLIKDFFKNFEKIYKKFAQKCKKSLKFFKHKILKNLRKFKKF